MKGMLNRKLCKRGDFRAGVITDLEGLCFQSLSKGFNLIVSAENKKFIGSSRAFQQHKI